jgi:hypothetical protein
MADVTSITSQFKGQRLATGLVTLSGTANDTISNVQLVSMVTAGSVLANFLGTTFASDAAAEAAWATLAGEVSMRGVTNLVTTLLSSFAWKATATVPSAALVNAAVAGTFVLLLRANHTITQ